IQCGRLVATHPVGQDQTQDADLLLVTFAAYLAAAWCLRATGILSERQEVLTDSGMGNIRSSETVDLRQLVEVAAPFLGNTVGIVQIELIELFNIGGTPT